MKYASILLVFILASSAAVAQKKIKVLFIGDSYTSVNNLPLTVSNLAKANGDTLIYDSNTPGGTTFHGQSTNATTLAKIAQGGWDYVVLQGQSEEPSFPPAQVETDTYPYAAYLDSLVHAADSCTETVFYMTWGHQNGDPPNCPFYSQICTYTGMQDRLTQSYEEMGQLDHATVAPAGEAWRRIVNQSHGFDMYMTDSIHPSIYGTYLVASVFYEVLFQKSVLNDTFVTAGIADSNAVQLRQAAHITVSDSLSKWLSSGHIPLAYFTLAISGAQATLTSTSINGENFLWTYGDGSIGSGRAVSHTYAASGIYPVTLTVYDHCKTSTFKDSVAITILPSGITANNNEQVHIYPNPAGNTLYVDLGDSDIKVSAVNLANARGQIVRKVKPSAPLFTITLDDLPAGAYILQISGRGYPVQIVR